MLSWSGNLRQGLLLVALLALVAIVLPACGGGQDTGEDEEILQRPDRERYGTLDRSVFRRETTDLNMDGNPDQYRYFDAKETLILAVLERRVIAMARRIHIEMEAVSDPADRLITGICRRRGKRHYRPSFVSAIR